MRYYATVRHHSIIMEWEPLRATTLLGAKREATSRYLEVSPAGNLPGYGPLICIGGQTESGPIETVAVREIVHGGWMRP